MVSIEHLKGQSVFWSDEITEVKLWNRLEFRRGRGWAEVLIASAMPDGKSEVVRSRNPMVVIFVGWIMAVIVECGGDDVIANEFGGRECPPECEDGYIMLDDGNYEPCPFCHSSRSG